MDWIIESCSLGIAVTRLIRVMVEDIVARIADNWREANQDPEGNVLALDLRIAQAVCSEPRYLRFD